MVFKFAIIVYAGIGKITKCSSFSWMSTPVMERLRTIQVCNSCLCCYWKDNVVYKFVIHVYAGIGKSKLCSSL